MLVPLFVIPLAHRLPRTTVGNMARLRGKDEANSMMVIGITRIYNDQLILQALPSSNTIEILLYTIISTRHDKSGISPDVSLFFAFHLRVIEL